MCVEELLSNPIIRSMLAITIPDFVMSLVYFLYQFSHLITGKENRHDACTALGFVTYGIVIASLLGPAIVSAVTARTIVVMKHQSKPMGTATTTALLLGPWLLGFAFAAAAYSGGVLGSFRGLYCYTTRWDHLLSGGLTFGVFVLGLTATMGAYGFAFYHIRAAGRKANADKMSLIFAKKGLKLVGVFFLSWAIFSVAGFLHLVGVALPLEIDVVGVIFISVQPIPNFFLLMGNTRIRGSMLKLLGPKNRFHVAPAFAAPAVVVE